MREQRECFWWMILKTGSFCANFLIMEIDENGNLSKKPLIVKDRKVFDISGKCLDFGDAYQITTESGKMMITKKFISVWME